MRENLFALFVIIFWTVVMIQYVIQHKRIHEKIDGVETIDGITYLIKDTDVSYVMYKLNSTCISKVIKDKEFQTVGEGEGILKFGGINYSLNLRGSESDMNIGAAYRIKCEQSGNDVIMKVSFEKRDFKWWSPSTKQPGFEMRDVKWWPQSAKRSGLALNQAYHRFFKEVFDVQVIR